MTISSVVEVEDITTDPLAVNGVTSSMADLMKQCIDRLEKLEMKVSQPRPWADDGRVNQLQTGGTPSKMLELRSSRAHCPFLSSSTAPGK